MKAFRNKRNTLYSALFQYFPDLIYVILDNKIISFKLDGMFSNACVVQNLINDVILYTLHFQSHRNFPREMLQYEVVLGDRKAEYLGIQSHNLDYKCCQY